MDEIIASNHALSGPVYRIHTHVQQAFHRHGVYLQDSRLAKGILLPDNVSCKHFSCASFVRATQWPLASSLTRAWCTHLQLPEVYTRQLARMLTAPMLNRERKSRNRVPSIARDVMRLLPQLARGKVYLLRDRVAMNVG